MNHFESRLKKIEEIVSPKNKKVIILDYFSPEPQSWMEVKGKRYLIPLAADVENFIYEKTKLIRGHHICTLYLARDRTNKPGVDFSGLISKDDFVLSIRAHSQLIQTI